MKTLPLILIFLAPIAKAADIGFSGAQEAEATAEEISSSDITIRYYQLSHSGTEGPWKLETGVGWNTYDLDYSPVLFGTDETLGEKTAQLHLALTRQWNPEWSGTLKFRAYDGFSDYRSIWIAEFYRQFFGGFDDYYSPDPHGQSFGTSVKWDYLPGSGSAEFSLDFGRDEIAPGWSFNSEIGIPEADREVLDTLSGSLRVEQALNGWLKTEAELTTRQTSDRDARFGIRHSWAAAAGPVGFRLTGGYTEEAPSFDAVYGTALIEWKFLPRWSAHLGYRIYQDSGEIEASGFNALAPPVDSTEIFTGILWDRGDLAISAGMGLLDTDYEPLSEDNEFFGNLYRDREWRTFRLAASFRF
jgi:hypothetical protein